VPESPRTPLSAPGALPQAASFPLRPFVKVRPNVLLVGASTGGPNAVTELLKLARPALHRMPILIAQHMPVAFTAMFADHLRRNLCLDAAEAQHGEPLEKGCIYVAPGGKHMRVQRLSGGIRAVVEETPAVNFCRPSVDVMFQSGAQAYGRTACAAPPPLLRPEATCWRRTRPPAWSGACPAPWRGAGFARVSTACRTWRA
jgi:two-component system, chemotaxis family, protein-glutamate methylesterase/glutaminase